MNKLLAIVLASILLDICCQNKNFQNKRVEIPICIDSPFILKINKKIDTNLLKKFKFESIHDNLMEKDFMKKNFYFKDFYGKCEILSIWSRGGTKLESTSDKKRVNIIYLRVLYKIENLDLFDRFECKLVISGDTLKCMWLDKCRTKIEQEKTIFQEVEDVLNKDTLTYKVIYHNFDEDTWVSKNQTRSSGVQKHHIMFETKWFYDFNEGIFKEYDKKKEFKKPPYEPRNRNLNSKNDKYISKIDTFYVRKDDCE